MSIHRIGSDLIRPPGPKGSPGSGSGTSDEVEEAARVQHPDRIDISAEGRALAAHRLDEEEGISQSRIDELRDRIRDGFYDRPSIAEKLAERLQLDGLVEVVI